MSSGDRAVHRLLSRRGNRQLNHAIHIAAITQIRYPHTDGRALLRPQDRRRQDEKEALRALKRRISDAVYRHLLIDAAKPIAGPGGQPGTTLTSSVTGLDTLNSRLFGSATPEPTTTLRPTPSTIDADQHDTPRHRLEHALDNKEEFDSGHYIAEVMTGSRARVRIRRDRLCRWPGPL